MTSSSTLAGNTFFGMDLKKIQARWMKFRRLLSKRVLLIDFDSASVTMAEAQIQSETVTFDHVRRYQLPEEALERGVPAEPVKMAALIRGFCQEAAIPAHRAAVVLSHDAAFTTVVKLPSSVPPESALGYALDPKSAVQLPIQLDQMEVDVVPLAVEGEQRSYFITAVPCKLVDRVIDTLQAADLEMVRLQVGLFAQLQHLTPTFADLAPGDGFLHLEMLRDCTQTTFLGPFGPIKLARLPAIRDFPELPDQPQASAADGVLNAEAQIIASDAYLPLSDLDLRSLQKELRQFIQQCTSQYPDLRLKGLALAGVNSAHPTLASLLQESLGLPVQVSRPLATPGVGQLTPETPIVIQSLGRLVGLGMSLLSASVSSPLTDGQPEALPAHQDVPEPSAHQPVELDDVLVPAEPVEAALTLVLSPSEEEETPIQPPQSTPAPPDPPLFSLEPLAEQDQEQPEPESATAQTTAPLEALSDADEVPFSLGDLMSSYQAKATEAAPTANETLSLDSVEDDSEDRSDSD